MTVDHNKGTEEAAKRRSMATATMTSTFSSSQKLKSESYSEDLSSKLQRGLQLQDGQRKKGKPPMREDSAPVIICEHVSDELRHDFSISGDEDDFPIEEFDVTKMRADQSIESENGTISKSPSTSSLTVPSFEIDEKRPPLLRGEAQDEDMITEVEST